MQRPQEYLPSNPKFALTPLSALVFMLFWTSGVNGQLRETRMVVYPEGNSAIYATKKLSFTELSNPAAQKLIMHSASLPVNTCYFTGDAFLVLLPRHRLTTESSVDFIAGSSGGSYLYTFREKTSAD